MNDALKMQISAYVDGELPENESELLLRRLSQDAAMRQQAAEYLAIGRLIRRDAQLRGVEELRGRIAEALGAESLPAPVSAPHSGSRITRPLAGFAIAASVAVLALVALRQVDVPEPESTANTEPPANEMLDSGLLNEMRILHSTEADSADRLARFVTLEISEEDLVQVAPVSRPLAEDETAEQETDPDEESNQTRRTE